MIRWARSLMIRWLVSTPRWLRSLISFNSTPGLTATPLPITQVVCREKMPDGMRWRANCPRWLTTVCPALSPPEKRMTYLAFSASMSTIFPLPSSPHCAPITAITGIILLPTAPGFLLPGISLRFRLLPHAIKALPDRDQTQQGNDRQNYHQSVVDSAQPETDYQ